MNTHGKRALLRQMGIDVWVLRQKSGDGQRAQGDVRPAEASRPDAAIGRPSAPAPPRESGISGESTESPVPSASGQRPPASLPEPAALPPVAPFTVVCFAKGDVLMLVEPENSKAAMRFSLDLLSAASSVWGGEFDRLDFDWPQPGIDNTVSTQRRALGAFLDKQLADRDPGLLLVGADVAERLEQLPENSLLLPPLENLMIRGDLKRALWADLQERR